jgi:hypothetical protein
MLRCISTDHAPIRQVRRGLPHGAPTLGCPRYHAPPGPAPACLFRVRCSGTGTAAAPPPRRLPRCGWQQHGDGPGDGHTTSSTRDGDEGGAPGRCADLPRPFVCTWKRREREKVWVADKRIPLESKMVI